MAKRMTMKQLRDFILSEADKIEKELAGVKAREVEASEYADTLEEPIEWEKELALKPTTKSKGAMLETIVVQESKALRLAKALRKKRLKLQEAARQEELVLENKRLKQAIKRIKSSR